MPRKRTPAEAAAHFWSKVDKSATELSSPHVSTPCWRWTGYVEEHGYGRTRWLGRKELTHRIAWMLAGGLLPTGDSYHGICVLHRCDNPACVRLEHLFLGTHTDNMSDCAAKGRGNPVTGEAHYARARPEQLARGESHGSAKLTAAAAPEIRRRAAKESYQVIANEFGVSRSTVSHIACRRKWAHLP